MPKATPDKIRKEIIRLYQDGSSPYRISQELQGIITPEGARHILRAEGIELRGRSEAKTRKDLPSIELLKTLYLEAGESCYRIGQKYGMSPATVYLRLARAGVPLRDHETTMVLREKRKKEGEL